MRFGGRASVVVSVSVGAIIASLLGAHASATEPAGSVARPATEVITPQMNDCLVADIDNAWAKQAPIEIVDCAEVHNAQVFKTLDYPSSGLRPSELLKQNTFAWTQACSQDEVLEWLGAPKDTTIPLRLVLMFRLPTDRQWEAGARWVVCTASHPHPSSYGAESRGTLPDLFASTPRLDWVECLDALPPRGKFSFLLGCTSASQWLFTGNVKIKGKVTRQYPDDLKATANATCAKASAAFAKAGARVQAFGALFPKKYVFKRDPYAECFIPRTQWNGRL